MLTGVESSSIGQGETTKQIEKEFFVKYLDINDAKKHT
jgi:hypothetical protein